MQNGQNRDSLWIDDIENEIRKPGYHRPADGTINDWARFREVPYRLKALSNRHQELIPEPDLL
jgi:hypothetical protein